jgi:hypothetical protein
MNEAGINIADYNPFDYEKKHYPNRKTVRSASVVKGRPESASQRGVQAVYQSSTC